MVVDTKPLEVQFPSSDLHLEVINVVYNSGPSQEEPERAKLKDIPVIFNDWSGGGGISQAMDATPSGYSYAQNVVTRHPGVLTPSGKLTEVVLAIPGVTPGEITGCFEQDGTLYFLAGRYVIAIANGTDPGPITTVSKDFGSNVQAVSVEEFGSAAYIGTIGAGGTLWRKSVGGGWSNTDPATGSATLVRRTLLKSVLWTVNEPALDIYQDYYILWGQDTDDPRAGRYVAGDPLTPGNWSGPIPILNRTYPVNALASSNRHIWAGTPATVVDIDQRNAPLPLNREYFRWPYDVTLNASQMLYFNKWLYVVHKRGLDRVFVGDTQPQREDIPGFCDWRQGVSAETPVVPIRWSNLFTLDGCLGCGVWNGTDSYINFGIERERLRGPGQTGPGPLAWYLGEYYIPGERITYVHPASPSGQNPRIWFATVDGSGATRLRWASLPESATPMEEILNNLDSNGAYVGDHSFAPSGKLWQSKIALGDQAARKMPDRYDIQAERLTATTTVGILASAEDGPSVSQGVVNTSPRGSLLPVDPLTTGHNIGLVVELTGTDKLPPVVREVRMRTRVRVEQAPSRLYTCLISPGQSQRNTGQYDASVRQRRQKLLALQTQAAVTMKDELGETRRVIVEEGIKIFKVPIKPNGADQNWMTGPEHYNHQLVAQFAVSILPSNVSEIQLDQVVTPVATVEPPFWDDGSVWEP